MLFSGLTPTPISVFGGLCTLNDRMNLPPNMSPNSQNVVYSPGSAMTRFGLTTLCTQSGGNNATGLMNYINLSGVRTQLAYFNGGTTFLDTISGASIGNIDTNFGNGFMNGTSLYGKAWLAFSSPSGSSLIGADWPRKWDGTTLNFIGMAQPTPQSIAVSEVANTGTTTTAGNHLVRVTFEDVTGASSPPSLYTLVTTTGGPNTGIQITGLPLGPVGTVRRVIWLTTASDGAFIDGNGFHTTQNYFTLRASSMIVADNTTTTVIVAATDGTLSAGESILSATPYNANLFSMYANIPPCVGMVSYKNRMFYYNILGSITPHYMTYQGVINNYNFKGYNGNYGPGGFPLFWVLIGAGANYNFLGSSAGAAGSTLRITADGATATLGVTQGITSNSEPVPFFTPGVQYGVRIRVKKSAGSPFSQGNLYASSQVGGGTNFTFTTPLTGLTSVWQTIETGALIQGQNSANPGPNGANALQVGMSGTPKPAGAAIDIDWIDFYAIGQERDGSKVIGSKIGSPQMCDSLTGVMFVQKDNGQDIKAGFVLRDNLYFVKERSIYTTADNGSTEPSGWTISQVDDTIGCPCPTAVAAAEGQAVIASRSGAYLFNGAIGDMLSHEIEPTWKRINWQYSYTISVIFDTERKMVYISVPLDAATTPSHLLVLNYEEGWGDASLNSGYGRKWTIWQFGSAGASSMLLAEQTNLSRLLYVGCADSSGNIYYYDAANTTGDNGVAINAYYETVPIGVPDGPSLHGGILAWVAGAGTLTMSSVNPVGTVTTVPGGTFTPASPDSRNWQFIVNLPDYEKVSYRVTSNALSTWFNVRRITAFIRPSPFLSPARGSNP